MNTEGWGQTLCANKTGCAGLDEPVTGTRGKLESGEFKQQKLQLNQFVGGKQKLPPTPVFVALSRLQM